MGVDLARATRVISPIQIRSIAQASARINIWTGAIRSGKTVASLLRWLIFVASAPTSGRLVMVGKTGDTIARNLFAVLTDPAIFGDLAHEVHYTRGANTAVILGRQIEVIGANDARSESRLRGMTVAGSYVDEATLVPREFWVQLLGRMSVAGAQMFATTNPDNPAHWLRKEFIQRSGELGLRHWHFTLDDNPALSTEYKNSIKAEFVGLFYRRFVLGHWVAAEGAIFDMFDEQVHVVPKLPQIARWIACGIDYGTTNPFAALMIGLGVDGRLYVTREYRYDSRQKRRSLTDAEYSTALREWMDGVPIPGTNPPEHGVRPEWTVVDPSAASFRQQLYRDGVVSALADNSVLDGIRQLSTLFGHRLLKVHESCTGLIEELPGYSWDDKAAEKGVDIPIKADDHSIDALRYGVHTTEAAWRPGLAEPDLALAA